MPESPKQYAVAGDIGGGVAAAGDLLLEPLREIVRKHAWTGPGEVVDILQSTLGDDAGLYGGAALAFRSA